MRRCRIGLIAPMKPSTLEDLKTESAHYRAMADRIDVVIAFAQREVVSDQQTTPPVVDQPAVIRFRRTIKLTKADATEQALRNAQGPLKKTDLIKAVISMGTPVDNLDSFSSILSRDKRFRPVGDGRWTLTNLSAANGVEKGAAT